ncbi:MAG: YihY family inner membrane protein [Candidatus Hydrogenedentes bacterium]|nr:YihY family inner membrane protein [Candidatus Hydrogenedentota bacterium]
MPSKSKSKPSRISARVQQIFDALERGRRFVTHDVWYIGRPGEEIPHGLIIKQVRVLILLVRNLLQGAFLMRAAALTFTSLLSVVPCVWILLIVIQKLNLGVYAVDFVTDIAPRNPSIEQTINLPKQIAANVSGIEISAPDINGATSVAPPIDANEEVIRRLLQWIFADVDTDAIKLNIGADKKIEDPIEVLLGLAHGMQNSQKDPNAITVIGLATAVLFTVFGMMWNVESAFNSIWSVRRTRSWYRIFSDYLLIMIFVPFAVAAVLGVTIALQKPSIQLGPFAWMLRVAQYFSIWAVFSLLYVIVPNTKVRWRYALLGAAVAGTLWLLAAWAYFNLQIGVTRNSLIYSGFALFPLLMAWMYLSWIIVLFGAELTFAYQNERTFAMERHSANASHAYKEAVGLRAMVEISRRFDEGSPGMAIESVAVEWNVPTGVINEVMDQLEEGGLVATLATEPITYAPARSLDRITVGDVVNALREAGREPSALREDETLRPLLAEIEGRGSRLMTASLDAFVRRFYPQHDAIEVMATDPRELPQPE